MDDNQQNHDDIDEIEKSFDESVLDDKPKLIDKPKLDDKPKIPKPKLELPYPPSEKTTEEKVVEGISSFWGAIKKTAQQAKDTYDDWSAEKERLAEQQRIREAEEKKLQEEEDERRKRFTMGSYAELMGAKLPEQEEYSYHSYMLVLPEGEKWRPDSAITLIESFEAGILNEEIKNALRLSIHADAQEIKWIVSLMRPLGEPQYEVHEIEQLFRSQYPNLKAIPYHTPSGVNKYRRYACLFAKHDHWAEPALSASDIRSVDPLSTLTQTMDSLQEGELVRYDVVVPFARQLTKNQVLDYLTAPALEMGEVPRERYFSANFWENLGYNMVWTRQEVERLKNERVYIHDASTTKRYLQKATQTLYTTTISLTFDTPDPNRLGYMDTIVASFGRLGTDTTSYSTTFSNFSTSHEDCLIKDDEDDSTVLPLPQHNWISLGDNQIQRAYTDGDMDTYNRLCNERVPEIDTDFLAQEVAALWHLPHDGMTASKILWTEKTPETCLPEILHNIEGIHIGTSCGIDVHLPTDDRTTHTMIIGKNGTGKTSLMHHLVHDDIASGRGVCVIDPQGRWIPKILQASIPQDRIDDVVVLDLSMEIDGVRHPAPLNPLYKVADDEVSFNIVDTLRRFDREFSGTQMEYLLELSLRTLGAKKQPTLRDIRKLFRNTTFRDNLIAQSNDFDLKDDWADFNERSATQQRNDTFPLFRRLRQIASKKEVVAITCHPEPLDIGRLVSQNKIILVSLGGGGNEIEAEDRIILGSAIVAQIERAAMKGAIKQAPYLLYIDEAQNFVNTPLNQMLAQVRQHGLGLVLANQFLSQLTGEVQDAVEGNVGTMFSFEIGHSDARIMRHYMTTFEQDELTSLGKYKAAVSMRYQDNRQPSFLLETLPPPGHDLNEATAKKRELEVRRKSVANYTPKTYDEVIAMLMGNDDASDTDESGNGDGDDFTERPPEA